MCQRIAWPRFPGGDVVGVKPNRHYSFDGIEFDTVPAYNVIDDRIHHHPKENGWVGYTLNVNGTRVYHAGDTDFITEMEKIVTGLALLPMGGTYVMDVDEVISASKSIKAEKVSPMHYRALLGRGTGCSGEEIPQERKERHDTQGGRRVQILIPVGIPAPSLFPISPPE